jgi:hypothetical protein
VGFTPTPDQLLPELTLRQEFVVLARALWREGYADHLAGHITVNLGDGTLLCNPWFISQLLETATLSSRFLVFHQRQLFS